jgi:APA family basic amino acid/polyamine antiporter
MLPVYFAYTGWNALVYIGGEVTDPQRNLRRGLFLGPAAVTVVYLVVVGGLVSVLGFGGLAGAPSPASAAFTLLLGPWAGLVLDLLIILAVLGTINATIMTGSRIYFAMARDKVFLKAAGVLDPTTGSPRFSLWLQAIWACVLVLPAATDKLLSCTTTAMIALSMLSVGAALKLRPDANPAPAIIYLLISVAVLAGTVLDQGFVTALAAPAAAALMWVVLRAWKSNPGRG